MNPNIKFFLISLSLSSICSLNVNGLNDFRQDRALNGSRNRREYERNFERCIERCEDKRDRDGDYDRRLRKDRSDGKDDRRDNKDYDRRDDKDYDRRNDKDYDRRNDKDYDRRDNKDYDRRDNKDYDRRERKDYDRRDNKDYDRHDDKDYDRRDRKEIEWDFERCEERCEENLIRDERRSAELEADEYLSIRYPNIEGSVSMEYADLDDEDDNEVEIKYRIENGPTSCNDCKLAIVDECKLANVDGDTLLELDGDGYLLDTEVEFDDEGEARNSLDFDFALRSGDLEDFECMYVVLFQAELQSRKLRGADTGKPSVRKLRNRDNEFERISGEVENLGEPVTCGQLVSRRSNRSDRSNRSRCRRR